MRDKLTHDYFGVDLDIVWRTCKEDLVLLKTTLKSILNKQDLSGLSIRPTVFEEKFRWIVLMDTRHLDFQKIYPNFRFDVFYKIIFIFQKGKI